MVELPRPIDELVRTVNGGDTAGFLALLSDDCVVDDWGSIYSGRHEIRVWSDRELIGAKGLMTVRHIEQSGPQICLLADWKSSFYTGPGRFLLHVASGKITSWRIQGA
jgi:hypothetical protein